MYHYGLIGNCQISALISEIGSIDWLCLPRPDSPPVFGRLLDPDGGSFSIELEKLKNKSQYYLPNTNILITILEDENSAVVQVTDFCPRFEHNGRVVRPYTLLRKIEPIRGIPVIQVICQPINGWQKERVQAVNGNGQIQFHIREEVLTLTTSLSISEICDQKPFRLHDPVYFDLTWGSPSECYDRFGVFNQLLDQTETYWKNWVKRSHLPVLYQKETIRSALVLKLHCYEDTGAILAALTTSLPEELNQTRNWDYRYCWLRDSYFVLSAFQSLGHFEEMEGFLNFLSNLVHQNPQRQDGLRPVYALDRSVPLPEKEHLNWTGYFGTRPVRSQNQAAEHVQNDIYGEMILAVAPIFLDERFQALCGKEQDDLLEYLTRFSIRTLSQPDAGLWEIRNGWRVHSFSHLMSWAGIEKAKTIQEKGYLKHLDIDLLQAEKRAQGAVESAKIEGSIRNGPGDPSLDSALLLLPILHYPSRELNETTVLKIAEELKFIEGPEGFLYRYIRHDDFGSPKSTFVICSFWLVQALARLGRNQDAQRIMKNIMTSSNHLGLFSEHYLPSKKIQSGNFPQAYSHVGQILAASAVSPS